VTPVITLVGLVSEDPAANRASRQYRASADRLQALAVELRRAGDVARSIEAARAADRAFRAARAEETNPEPRR
jgi:hypothetical protein